MAGNLLTIIFFALNRRLRKKSLFLVVNMAFADLMLGTVSLPIYACIVGDYFQLWTNQLGILPSNVYYSFLDNTFIQASLISAAFMSCERFYAIYWPLKHGTSMRAYCIVVGMTWTVALLNSGLLTVLRNFEYAMFVWVPNTLILTFVICDCHIGIWIKFQQGSVALQQNRAVQKQALNKDFTVHISSCFVFMASITTF